MSLNKSCNNDVLQSYLIKVSLLCNFELSVLKTLNEEFNYILHIPVPFAANFMYWIYINFPTPPQKNVIPKSLPNLILQIL